VAPRGKCVNAGLGLSWAENDPGATGKWPREGASVPDGPGQHPRWKDLVLNWTSSDLWILHRCLGLSLTPGKLSLQGLTFLSRLLPGLPIQGKPLSTGGAWQELGQVRQCRGWPSRVWVKGGGRESQLPPVKGLRQDKERESGWLGSGLTLNNYMILHKWFNSLNVELKTEDPYTQAGEKDRGTPWQNQNWRRPSCNQQEWQMHAV
jgi:hypothetical protein